MNKVKLFGKLLLVVGLLGVTNYSCTNLDEKVYSSLTTDNFYTTEGEITEGVGGCYTAMYGLVGHNGLWSDQEVASGELMIPQRGGDWYDGGQWLRMYRHEYNDKEESFNNAWVALYTGVVRINTVIEAIEGKGLGTQWLPELKCLRAFYYFWLCDMFGNVPYVDKTVAGGADEFPGNARRADVYANALAELEANVGALSKDNGGNQYARMNYYSGQALLAKMKLNAGVYTGAADYAGCIKACDEIINSAKFIVEGDYFANFTWDNQNSKENIFVIPYDAVNAGGLNFGQMSLHYESQKTFNMAAQPWNGYCAATDFYNSYDANDTRRTSFLAGQQYASDGVTELVDGSADPSDPDGPKLNFTPAINEHFPGCWRQAGARMEKFRIKNGSTQNLDNDFPWFRYSDVLLMKAEAMARNNGNNFDAAALALVNDVHTKHSGLAAYGSINMDELYAERGREMFAEAWSRNDAVRFGKYDAAHTYNNYAGTPVTFRPASTPDRQIFPIPRPQLDANPNLDQNAGY